MFSLLLSVLCSLSISMILKFNETRGGERAVVAGANYIVAATLGALLSERLAIGGGTLWTLFGGIVGVGFVAGFLLQMRSIHRLGLAVPISVARIATLGPVAGAMIVYGDRPSMLQTVGIVVGVGSFLMLGFSQRRRSDAVTHIDPGAIGLLVLLFLVMVLNDFSMKVVQEGGIDKDAFLFHVFATAALICWIGIAALRVRVRRRDLALGALLGLPNYFSSYFIILALDELGAASVFPIISAAGVILAAAAGVLIWKERPNRAAWIGIALAAVAVALLGSG